MLSLKCLPRYQLHNLPTLSLPRKLLQELCATVLLSSLSDQDSVPGDLDQKTEQEPTL